MSTRRRRSITRTSLLTTAGIVLGFNLISGTVSSAATAEDTDTLEGVVTLNESTAWAGITLVFGPEPTPPATDETTTTEPADTSDATTPPTTGETTTAEPAEPATCGTATTTADGRYSVALGDECAGGAVVAYLGDLDASNRSTNVLSNAADPGEFNPTFTLTADELAMLPPPPTVSVDGVVRINGESSSAGVVLNFEVTRRAESAAAGAQESSIGDLCGTAVTDSSGSYRAELARSCPPGTEVVAVLGGLTERTSSGALVLTTSTTRQTFNPTYSLTDAQVAEVSPAAAEPETTGVERALLQQTESVFDQVEPLLIALLVGGALLLLGMAVAVVQVSNRRYDFLNKTIAEQLADADADRLAFLQASMEIESEVQRSRYRVFRWMVEGLVLSFVVIAVIALGAAGKVEAQGVVSVLAALVGYAAGRATSS